jgi:hypothetical protein
VFVLIGAVLALGLVSVGGPLPAADAAEPWVCKAKGKMDNNPLPLPDGGSVAFWQINFTGTCVGPDGVQQVTGSGGNGGYYDYAGECAVFYPGTIGPNGTGVYVNLDVGDKTFQQWWSFPTHYSGPFEIRRVVHTPHPHIQEHVGAGIRFTRLALQCPGDPAADFTFSFVQDPA